MVVLKIGLWRKHPRRFVNIFFEEGGPCDEDSNTLPHAQFGARVLALGHIE